MTSLKTLLIGAALTVFSLPAWAETDITFWHSFGGGNGKALEQIISDFEKKRPDIKVTAQEIGDYNDIVTKLQAAIPAKRYPDVVLLEITRYGLFAEKGILENLTPYLDKDPLKEQLYDFALDVGKYKGSNYVIPFNSSTPVTYYNKALLRAAGLPDTVPLKNFSDLLGAATTVQAKLGSQGKFGISPMGQFARWGIVMSNDSDLIDPVSNDVIVDLPKTIAAYEWMADLVRKYKVASVDGITDENAAKAQFTAGSVAINLDSTGVFGGFKKALGDDLGVAPFPCEAVCRVPIGGAGIGIVSMIDDEKKKAAYDFISYMASPEANADLVCGHRLPSDQQEDARHQGGSGCREQGRGYHRFDQADRLCPGPSKAPRRHMDAQNGVRCMGERGPRPEAGAGSAQGTRRTDKSADRLTIIYKLKGTALRRPSDIS